MLLQLVTVFVTWIRTFLKTTAVFWFCNFPLFNTIVIRKKNNLSPKNSWTLPRPRGTLVLLILLSRSLIWSNLSHIYLFLVYSNCHELWLRNFRSTWPWEGHMTKPGLTHHVTCHVTNHMTRCLTLRLSSHVTRNESMTWCTPTSVGVICVTSTTDTRTREMTKLFKIGSALTPTRVNATQS